MPVLLLTVFIEIDEQQLLAMEFRGGFQQGVDLTVQALLRADVVGNLHQLFHLAAFGDDEILLPLLVTVVEHIGIFGRDT